MSKCWYTYKGIGGCILRYALTHRLLTRYFLMSWCYGQPSVLTPHVYPLTDKMYYVRRPSFCIYHDSKQEVGAGSRRLVSFPGCSYHPLGTGTNGDVMVDSGKVIVTSGDVMTI